MSCSINLWGQSTCRGGLGRLGGLAGRSLLWSCCLLPLFGFLCVMGGTPATDLGQALMPGALAVGVFVPAGRTQMVEMGMQDVGAHVLSQEDLKRIGAGMAAVQGNGTLDSDDGTTAGPAVTSAPAVFDWNAEYTYSHGVQAFIYGFPYLYLAQVRYKWTHDDSDPEHLPYTSVGQFWHAQDVLDATFQDGGAVRTTTRCTRSHGST